MALLVGVFCGSAKEVLTIWLGPQFAPLAPVASYSPLPDRRPRCYAAWNAMLAVGKIKVPAIVTLVMGAGNVVLGFMLARRMGLMGIAVSGCVMLMLRNAVFTPWYLSGICRIGLWKFWRELGIGAVYGGAIYMISIGVIKWISPDSMSMLAISLLLSAGLGALLLLPLGLRELRGRV